MIRYNDIDFSIYFYPQKEDAKKNYVKSIPKLIRILKKHQVFLLDTVYSITTNKSYAPPIKDCLHQEETAIITAPDGYGLQLKGKTLLNQEGGASLVKNIIILEIFILNGQLHRFSVCSNVDIWTPIGLEDRWQIRSGFQNVARLEKSLNDIQKTFDCIVEPAEITKNFGFIQYGFRLYNYPSQIENALEYAPIALGNFDLERYKQVCSTLEAEEIPMGIDGETFGGLA